MHRWEGQPELVSTAHQMKFSTVRKRPLMLIMMKDNAQNVSETTQRAAIDAR